MSAWLAPRPTRSADPSVRTLALSWLIRLRWLTLAAQALSVWSATDAPETLPVTLLVVFGASNVLFALLRPRASFPLGAVLVADTALLTLLLHTTGGPTNPFTALYFVYITMAAVLLGTRWVLAILALSLLGYAALFLADDPHAHHHHDFEAHLRGMWIAFGVAAGLIAAFVTRLTRALSAREAELAEERERASESAQVAALTSLAAGAAHELGTPIGTIMIAAGELERALGAEVPAEVREDLRLIREEAKRCRAVLDGLSAAGGEARGEGFRAMTLGEVSAQALARLDEGRRARVAVQGDVEAEVELPEAALSLALANLLRNALEASAPDGRVTLNLKVEGGEVSFRVVDRGAGMSEAVLARASDPFFSTKNDGGMGLGLFLVRTVAEQLGGALTLASSVGSGTTARLSLPRSPRRTV